MTTQHDPHRVGMEDPMAAVVWPALKVGAACGTVGFLFGGTAGILRSTKTPILFAAASTIQTFTLGFNFWAVRSTILSLSHEPSQPADRIRASAAAGAGSGALTALLTRGRHHVLPAALMWCLIGGGGQMAFHRFLSSPRTNEEVEPFWTRVARQRWSPVRVLSDEEYIEMLRERMLKVDVEIAILDDKIAELRVQQERGGQLRERGSDESAGSSAAPP